MMLFAGTLAYSVSVLEENSKLKAYLTSVLQEWTLLFPYKLQLCSQ